MTDVRAAPLSKTSSDNELMESQGCVLNGCARGAARTVFPM